MSIRNHYLRVTSRYGRVSVAARHALRVLPVEGHRQVTSPEGAVARIDRQRLVLDAMRELPEPCRSALFHCHIDGLAPEVVARRIGVSTEAVAARLRRALQMLRERLGTIAS